MSKKLTITKITRSRVSVPENYVNAEGLEKTFWHDIGTITTFTKEDGSHSTQLFIPTLNLRAQVFRIEAKE